MATPSLAGFDPTSAASVRQLLTDINGPRIHACRDMLTKSGLPVAAAGLVFTGTIISGWEKSSIVAAPAVIAACQELVDAGAEPAPIGIALSLLLNAHLLDDTTASDSLLRQWYYPPAFDKESGLAIKMRAAARPEVEAAVIRGSGLGQPAPGDTLAWIVYCYLDVDLCAFRTQLIERVLTGLELAEIGAEIALASVLSLITTSDISAIPDLDCMTEKIAAGFARERGRRLELPPVII
jgi:hypothetical protein